MPIKIRSSWYCAYRAAEEKRLASPMPPDTRYAGSAYRHADLEDRYYEHLRQQREKGERDNDNENLN